ncbi:MAG: hypothetical protein GEV10_26240 [Streptosporangiales bacterium]|nr:hypothetical protein [Streptosporangiales bacterium]
MSAGLVGRLGVMVSERRVVDDDRLDRQQLAALDSLWRAHRAGEVDTATAGVIEDLIRRGHVPGAQKRLSAARRRAREHRK